MANLVYTIHLSDGTWTDSRLSGNEKGGRENDAKVGLIFCVVIETGRSDMQYSEYKRGRHLKEIQCC